MKIFWKDPLSVQFCSDPPGPKAALGRGEDLLAAGVAGARGEAGHAPILTEQRFCLTRPPGPGRLETSRMFVSFGASSPATERKGFQMSTSRSEAGGQAPSPRQPA